MLKKQSTFLCKNDNCEFTLTINYLNKTFSISETEFTTENSKLINDAIVFAERELLKDNSLINTANNVLDYLRRKMTDEKISNFNSFQEIAKQEGLTISEYLKKEFEKQPSFKDVLNTPEKPIVNSNKQLATIGIQKISTRLYNNLQSFLRKKYKSNQRLGAFTINELLSIDFYELYKSNGFGNACKTEFKNLLKTITNAKN